MVQDGIKTAYAYDALGQLIRVDDGQENATWLYTYDNGGNIRSKQKFALGVTTGEPLESKHFSYSNDAWRDQLTAVDGVAITYDDWQPAKRRNLVLHMAEWQAIAEDAEAG